MAGFAGLEATGTSIVGLLNRGFAAHPDASGANLQAFLATASELKTLQSGQNPLVTLPAVSVYCYKVTVDRQTRPSWSAVAAADGVPRIPLDLYLLVAAWATTAEEELRWLGLAAQLLESRSVLTGTMLDPAGQWQPDEAITVVPDELALDSVSEAFQALSTDYRLSLCYIARVVVIHGIPEQLPTPVTTVAARAEIRPPETAKVRP